MLSSQFQAIFPSALWSLLSIYAPLSFLASLCYLILRYPDRVYGTRSRPDLPGPPGLPLLGNLLGVLRYRSRIAEYMARHEKTYGELASVTLPVMGRIILINRPEWIEHVRKRDAVGGYGKGKHVLSVLGRFPGQLTPIGSEGEQWRFSRKVIQPLFTGSFIEDSTSRALNHALSNAHQLLRKLAFSNESLDFDVFCGHLVLDVLCRSLVDVDWDILTSSPTCLNSHALYNSVSTLSRISSHRLADPTWRISELFNGERAEFSTAHHTLDSIVIRLIESSRSELQLGDFTPAGTTPTSRPAAPSPPSDLLGIMLRNPRYADNIQLMTETIGNMMFAGRDNNQSTLNWSLYALTRNSTWLAKMRAEATANKERGVDVKFGDHKRFPIHQAVFHETLRMWPGVPKNVRIALNDDLLPGVLDMGIQNVRVDKGDHVIWLDTTMMRNPKVWGPTSNVFDPSRFLDENGLFIRPPAPKFHGFGFGARGCPGAMLAAFEFESIWASLLPAFDFTPVDSCERKAVDALTLMMDGEFLVNVKERVDDYSW